MSMKMNIPDNKYLGTLCNRGHDYKETGMSLRYKGNGKRTIKGSCYNCHLETQRRLSKTPERRAYRKAYDKKYLIDNRMYHYAKTKENKRKAMDGLHDYYVAKLIIQHMGLRREEITPELIIAKREIIKIKRVLGLGSTTLITKRGECNESKTIENRQKHG